MRRSLRLALGALILVLGGGAIVLATRTPVAPVRQAELHTFLHFGCKHHSHGRTWHRDHGRTLGVSDHRQGRPETAPKPIE